MSAQNKTYNILGVRIDALTMAEAAQFITERAADGDKPAAYVTKPYVEFLDRVSRDEHIKSVLNNSWLNLPDAVSTQWAAAYLAGRPSWWRVMKLGAGIILNRRELRKQIPEKFGGTKFAQKLLEEAAKKNLKVYLVGSPAHSDIAATARVITEQFPGVTIAGMWPGRLKNLRGMSLLEALRSGPVEADLAADLKRHNPDLILIGMGFPLQEELMAKLAPQLSHGVLIGEGGTFDYDVFGGKRRKAPDLFQRAGLEWLWRLILEPSRFRRQLAIPRFVWTVYLESKRR